MVCAVGVVLVSAQAAPAKPGYVVWPGARESRFTIKGSHGYRISVSHLGRGIWLQASNGDGTAVYLVPAAKPSGDGTIRATFPGVGRVDVRFNPSGRPRRLPPFSPSACTGGGGLRQRGTFRGTIRFTGDHGFTRVVAADARGYTLVSVREVCKGGADGNDSGDLNHSLTAYSRSHGQTVLFSATRYGSESFLEGEISYSAQTFERRGPMKIGRVAIVLGASDTFAAGGPAARSNSASVTPPLPFQGSAAFSLTGNNSADWEGTLEVDLPGAPGVELAGPSFSSQLCLNRRCWGDLPARSASGRVR
jgi:hypothetical protein